MGSQTQTIKHSGPTHRHAQVKKTRGTELGLPCTGDVLFDGHEKPPLGLQLIHDDALAREYWGGEAVREHSLLPWSEDAMELHAVVKPGQLKPAGQIVHVVDNLRQYRPATQP